MKKVYLCLIGLLLSGAVLGQDTLHVEKPIYHLNGKIGIGTNDPKYPLTVKGAINAEANGDYYGAWLGGEARTTTPSINLGEWHNYRGSIYWDATDRKLVFETKTATTLFDHTLVLEDGKVGIGTTSPATKLDVIGDMVIGNGGTRSSYAGTLKMINEGGNQTNIFLWQRGIASGHFGFKPNDNKLYITNSYYNGNLGEAAYSMVMDLSLIHI